MMEDQVRVDSEQKKPVQISRIFVLASEFDAVPAHWSTQHALSTRT